MSSSVDAREQSEAEDARTVLAAALGPERVRALCASLGQASEREVLLALATAARKLAAGAAVLDAQAQRALQALGYRSAGQASWAELGRVFLLLEACAACAPDAQLALLTRAYRSAGNAERCALLRALPLLSEPARFAAIAADACRSHVLDVFQAIACDNPYAAQHFDAPTFNQLVVKALFVGAPLSRILGLSERHNPELVRMVRDYAAERSAAGRSIPEDVRLVDPELAP